MNILRQILNCCFCTISSHEFLSVLSFYDFTTMPGSRCVNLKNLGLPDLIKVFCSHLFQVHFVDHINDRQHMDKT